MNKYILAIDQGTTSTRAFIFDSEKNIAGKAQKKLTQYYPEGGWIEHDPEEIWETTLEVIGKALARGDIAINEIEAIGITNQRETTLLWDKKTGKPIHKAIVWQDRRTADICNNLEKQGLEEKFKKKTGLLLDPYFSGTKIKWILDNVKNARKKAENGDLLFGTIDSWLIWKLTGGNLHVTDYTNASRTLIYNIHNLEWDQELLKILDIPENILPEVRSCSEVYGKTDPEVFFNSEVPISGIAGDQQAATFGQGCYETGMGKITYGTGAFVLMNTGKEEVNSEHGLISTIAWGIDDEITYALEGSIFNAGSAIEWLKKELKIIDNAAETEEKAQKVDNDGVYFVPAFTGLGAPYWEPEARGTIVGLKRENNQNHIIRATLEALVYQTKDVLAAMEDDSNINLKELRLDGGASNNNFILQFLADITDTLVERPKNIETTVTGAAYLAGLAVNFWENKDELLDKRRIDKKFESEISVSQREELYNNWKKAINTALTWSK